MREGVKVPQVIFKTRVRDESIGGQPLSLGGCQLQRSFCGQKGASSSRCQVPSLRPAPPINCPVLNALIRTFTEAGIDEIFVISVNDSFVMNKWLQDQDISSVKAIPDGSGEFNFGRWVCW